MCQLAVALLPAAPAVRPATTEAAPLGVAAPGDVHWVVRRKSNSPVWGGARHCGRRDASGSAPFASRWVRIFSITLGSSMTPRRSPHGARTARAIPGAGPSQVPTKGPVPEGSPLFPSQAFSPDGTEPDLQAVEYSALF